MTEMKLNFDLAIKDLFLDIAQGNLGAMSVLYACHNYLLAKPEIIFILYSVLLKNNIKGSKV
jgi:hypothetical protein